MPLTIDCDLHNEVPAVEALLPYLPDYWREVIGQTGFKGPVDRPYRKGAAVAARDDALPPGGGPAGSDLGLLRAQALDGGGAALGILNCLYAVDSVHNPDAAVALASAVNDWQVAEWLAPEPRLRASLVVPAQHPDLAAREIDRLGGHPGFVQVLLPARAAAPYGNRRYHPLYEAALRHDLAIGIHFGGAPGNPPTAAGWPSSYLEEYAGMAHVFQSQLLSLVCEGVFDRFPALRVALIESGVTWLPATLWRLDKEWKGLRREVPWVRRLPSEYVREHVRLTTAPFDAPPEPRHLLQLIEQLGADDLLLYASDYPHRHDDAPDGHPWLDALPDALRRKIRYENARDFYRL
ncbi:MAG TPA: amidohydrolase family protein [Thermomicrobiales bacterium]|nr:amidohydrolase family protein [Thermomicrobiales bacterium]